VGKSPNLNFRAHASLARQQRRSPDVRRQEGRAENGTVNANGQTVDGNIPTDSLVISKGGLFSGNVTKTNGQPSAQRPVYLIEDKRAGQQSA
jgi:hypothetical protein